MKMNPNSITDRGVINIYCAVIERVVDDWLSSYVYLMKKVGHINTDLTFISKQYCGCEHMVYKKTKRLIEAEKFFQSESYEFYGDVVGCYVPYSLLMSELKARANKKIYK